MGSITAHVLVGSSSYAGGLEATHSLALRENDRPLLSLRPFPRDQWPDGGRVASPEVRWVPTLERTLDDALLMVGLHVLRDDELVTLAGPLVDEGQHAPLLLVDATTPEQRAELYSVFAQREQGYRYKLVITVLDGALIAPQLETLVRFGMDLEVCRTTYLRERSLMGGGTTIEGSLS